MPSRPVPLICLVSLLCCAAVVAAPPADDGFLQRGYDMLAHHTWKPAPAELPQLRLDLAGSATTFDLLADFEGSSILFRVRDAATGEKLAVVKTETGNTSLAAEVYAWRLGCELGFSNLVVPTSPVRISGAALLKLRELVTSVSYKARTKEYARQSILEEVDRAIASGGYLQGVIKPWLTAFMFSGRLGDRLNLAEHPVAGMLKISGPTPDTTDVRLGQITNLYNPHGLHYGVIEQRQLAQDLSNIMLLDALMAQRDRFAGANLHFRNSQGLLRPGPMTERGRPSWNLGRVRLLALDCGAALSGHPHDALRDLKGTIVRGTRVERFDRGTVTCLRTLWARLLAGRNDDGSDSVSTAAALWRLGLGPNEAPLAHDLLIAVLDHVSRLETLFGEEIWLPACPPRGPDLPRDNPEIADPFFAFVIGVITDDLVGAWTGAEITGWITATGRETRLPLRHVRLLERRPAEAVLEPPSHEPALRCRLRLQLDQDLVMSMPYSILGYHPGTLYVSREVSATEWDFGTSQLVLHRDEGIQQAVVHGLRAMRLDSGWIVLDVDGWLDKLLGSKLDDTWVEAFALGFLEPLPALAEPVLEGLALGRSRSGRPLAGTFDFLENEVLPDGRPEARALSKRTRWVVSPRDEPADSRAWSWPRGR